MRDDPVKTDPTEVGKRIREMRKAKGWTLDRLAADSGVSKAFLSLVENGKHHPSGPVLLAVGRSLSVSVDFLLRGEAAAQEQETARSIEVPVELATLAADRGWTAQRVFELLRAQKAILARRSARAVHAFTRSEWSDFEERLSPYLDTGGSDKE